MSDMSPGDQFASALESSNAGNTGGVADTGNAAPQQTQAPSAPTPPASGGGHPAWNEYLKDIPEGFHGVVKPAFEKWDKEVQSKLQSVHSQYEPYKSFLDAQVDPQQLDMAWAMLNRLSQDPQEFYEALGKYYGFGGQGQDEETDEEPYDLGADPQYDSSKDPRIQQLEQNQQAIYEAMQQAQAQRQAYQAEQWLDGKINEATQAISQLGITPENKEAYGAAMRFITTTAMGYNEQNGGGGDEKIAGQNFDRAVQDFISFRNQVATMPRAGASAPPVMPTNGGTPSNRINTADMSDEDRRKYMADMLTAMQRNG